MHVDLLWVLSLLLAGCAAAAALRSPGSALKRIEQGRGRAGHGSRSGPGSGPEPRTRAGSGSPTRGGTVAELWSAGRAVLQPRAGAPPWQLRCVMAGVAGLVATWGWQLMIPDVGAIAWLAAPPVAVGVALVLGRVERPAVRVRRLRMIMDLPQILELLAAAMQAGLPLRTAVREVVDVCDGPLVEDLQGVLNSIDLGIPDAEAWRSLRDHPALGRVSIDLARSVDSGSMVVATLRRHARIARRDRRGAMEARARTVGVKSVPPLMICFVPAFLLICVVPIVVTAIRQAVG